MGNMFDRYENILDEYIPNNIKPNDNLSCAYPTKKLEPCRPILPYEEYDTKGNLVGYFWHYCDLVNLEFNIDGETTLLDELIYSPASEFLIGKKATITILDFRNNIVVEKIFDAQDKIIFEIDEELSKKMVKGVYYCNLVIWDNSGFKQTIFSNEDCVFHVK